MKDLVNFVRFKELNGHCDVPKRYLNNNSLGTWLGRQRQLYKKNNLSQNHIAKLESIEITWDCKKSWDEMYLELCEFKKIHGNCSVTKNYSENKLLGHWVITQRALYNAKNKYLTKERIELLNQIEFVWDINKEQWTKRFNDLCIYKEKNEHCNVPKRYPENPKLARWVGWQRIEYKNNKLSEQRIAKLNNIEFNWGSKKEWLDHLEDLKKFKNKFEHCIVPQNHPENPTLAQWVGKQRQSYKNKTLKKEYVHILNQMNFIWDPINASWEEKYLQLCEFKKTNGHCYIPQCYPQHPSLLGWINKQREYYKKKSLNANRLIKLESIGFIWDPTNTAWDEKYAALCKFKETNGHCNVPQDFPQDTSLAMWVGTQRHLYKHKNKRLTSTRINDLDEIGFNWNPTEEAWEKHFSALSRFKETNGNCNVPKNYPENQPLADWVQRQRSYFRKSKLSQTQIEKLNKIGFAWNSKTLKT